MHNLIYGDCLEEMPKLESQSVDLVLTDPPYGTTACKWDAVIPFEPMWAELKRLVKPRAAIVLTATQPFASALITSGKELFKYDWVWCKSRATDFIRAKLKPMGGHESILVFSLGAVANGSKRNMLYNPQGLRRISKMCKNSGTPGGAGFAGRNKENYGPNNKLHNPTYIQEFTGYPNTKLDFPSETNTVHPTQKPVALMEYMIRTYTNEGDTVLDFTMGSGTTGVACANLGRSFIGIEREQKYFDIARQRINDAISAKED